MVTLGHSSVGAIIGVVGVVAFAPSTALWLKLVVILVASIISHYVCDAVPHGHYRFDVKKPTKSQLAILGLDSVGVYALLWLCTLAVAGFGTTLLLISVGMFGAVLPDIWDTLVELKRIPNTRLVKALHNFHVNTLHWHNDPRSDLPNHGKKFSIIDIWQLATFVIALLLISTLPST